MRKKTKNWEKEFDERFKNDSFFLLHEEENLIKSFIRSLLKQERSQFISELRKESKNGI